MEPEAVAEGQKKMKALFNEYGVTPFTPMKGLLIQGPVFISFFLAISNMAEKVPSFKTGGAFWFPDLTVPDAMYVFPVLTALSFLATVEFNMQEGLEGNPVAGTMKKFSRGPAGVSFIEMLKKMSPQGKSTPAISASVDKSSSVDKKTASTAALSQRLRNLEKQVKQNKRLKKR